MLNARYKHKPLTLRFGETKRVLAYLAHMNLREEIKGKGLFLKDPGFGSKLYDETIAPVILRLHQLRNLLSQFRLIVRIDDPAKSKVLVAVDLERDSRVVLNVPHPVSLVTVLREEIESSLMSDIPDFD